MQGRLSLTAIQETVAADAGTVKGENERGETIYASTGNQLSMPRLYRTAAFCGRFRQAGGCDYCGASYDVAEIEALLRREGEKRLRQRSMRQRKRPQKEGSLRRRRRLGYLRLQRGLGRGGEKYEGIQLPELRRGSCSATRARRQRPARTAATRPSCRGSLPGELKPDFILPFRLGKRMQSRRSKSTAKGKILPAQSLHR